MAFTELPLLQSVAGQEHGSDDHMVLRRTLHHQNLLSTPLAREEFAQHAIASVAEQLEIHDIHALPPCPAEGQGRLKQHVDELRRDGITLLGQLLQPEQIHDIHQFLANKPVYPGATVWMYGDKSPHQKQQVETSHAQAVYKLDDLIDSPDLLELISDPFLLKLVEQYLGVLPTVYSPNLLWSFPGVPGAIAKSFHRDWDNYRHCLLMVYLTDVDSKSGAHCYARKSQDFAATEELVRTYQWGEFKMNTLDFFIPQMLRPSPPEAIVEEVFGENVLQIDGKAGCAFLVNPYGLHRGLPLSLNERLIFWCRFAIYDSGHSYDVSRGPLEREAFKGRVGDDPTSRYMFRTLARSEFSLPPTDSMHNLDTMGDKKR